MSLTCVATLSGHEDRAWCVAWSPLGGALASCGNDKTIRIWGKEGEKWLLKTTLATQHNRAIRSVSWSPCGKFLAASSFDSTTSIWDRRSGEFECTASLEGHENEVKCVAWSLSGAYIATCSRDKSVWIWEVEDEEYECASVLNKHTQDVKRVRWHPHAEMLASCGYDDTIQVFEEDDDDWSCSETLSGHESTVWSIAFNTTGNRLVSCSDDRTLKIWQSNSDTDSSPVAGHRWQQVCSLAGHHTRAIYDVDWSHVSGLIASCGGDNSIRVYREDTEHSSPCAPVFVVTATQPQAHQADVNSVAWHPQDPTLLASCGDEGLVKLWTVEM